MNEHEVLSLMKWLNSIDNKELKELLKNIKFGIEMEINLPDIDEEINVPEVMRYLADITSKIESEPDEDCISEYVWNYADQEIEAFVDRCIDDFDELEAEQNCKDYYYDEMTEKIDNCMEKEIEERIDECIENKKEELLNAGYEEDEIDEDALYDECENEFIKEGEIEDDCTEEVEKEYKDIIENCVEEARSDWEDDCYRDKREDFINYDLSDILYDLYYEEAYEYCKDMAGPELSYETIEKLEDIKDKFHEIIESLFNPVEYDGGDYHGSTKKYSDSYYLFKFERDGSLPYNSFEFICPPLTYKEILKKIPKLVEQLDKDIHIDVDTGHGWHIHVSEENEEKYNKATQFFSKLAASTTTNLRFPRIVYLLVLIDMFTDVSYVDIARKKGIHSESIANELRNLISKCFFTTDMDLWVLLIEELQLNKKIRTQYNLEEDLIDTSRDFNNWNFYIYDSFKNVYNNSDKTMLNWNCFRSFDVINAILGSSHGYDIRFVSKHKGIENRAPGGEGIIEVVKTPKEFKKILMDSLWRYYVMMNFEKEIDKLDLKTLEQTYYSVFPNDIHITDTSFSIVVGMRTKSQIIMENKKTKEQYKIYLD